MHGGYNQQFKNIQLNNSCIKRCSREYYTKQNKSRKDKYRMISCVCGTKQVRGVWVAW